MKVDEKIPTSGENWRKIGHRTTFGRKSERLYALASQRLLLRGLGRLF